MSLLMAKVWLILQKWILEPLGITRKLSVSGHPNEQKKIVRNVGILSFFLFYFG